MTLQDERDALVDEAPAARGGELRAGIAPPDGHVRSLREVELEHVQFALRACNGNTRQTAQALSISRDTLYHKIAECGLTASEQREIQDPARGTRGE